MDSADWCDVVAAGADGVGFPVDLAYVVPRMVGAGIATWDWLWCEHLIDRYASIDYLYLDAIDDCGLTLSDSFYSLAVAYVGCVDAGLPAAFGWIVRSVRGDSYWWDVDL